MPIVSEETEARLIGWELATDSEPSNTANAGQTRGVTYSGKEFIDSYGDREY